MKPNIRPSATCRARSWRRRPGSKARRRRARFSATPSSTITPRLASGRSASSASRSPNGSSTATLRSSSRRLAPVQQDRMPASLKTISPVDGRIYVERTLADTPAIAATLAAARAAQRAWRDVPVAERTRIATRFVAAMTARRTAIGEELSWQMGRPIRYTPAEVDRIAERARYMIAAAPEALADTAVEPMAGFTRFIRHEPLGIVFVVAPWNYPLLTAINAVIPAIVAGNAVVLKHSAQTPLVAERFA